MVRSATEKWDLAANSGLRCILPSDFFLGPLYIAMPTNAVAQNTSAVTSESSESSWSWWTFKLQVFSNASHNLNIVKRSCLKTLTVTIIIRINNSFKVTHSLSLLLPLYSPKVVHVILRRMWMQFDDRTARIFGEVPVLWTSNWVLNKYLKDHGALSQAMIFGLPNLIQTPPSHSRDISSMYRDVLSGSTTLCGAVRAKRRQTVK